MKTVISSLALALILAALFAAPVAAASPAHWGYPPYPYPQPTHIDYGWQPPPPTFDPNVPWVPANTLRPAQPKPTYTYYYPAPTWYQPPQQYYYGYYYPAWNYWYNPPAYTPPSYTGVSLSTTFARRGDTVTAYVGGFPANADVDFRIGRLGAGSSLIYDAVTGPDGRASISFAMPVSANPGELWNVFVVTTEMAPGYGKEAYSPNIYIGN